MYQLPALWRPCTQVDLDQAHGHPTCLGVNTHKGRGAEQNPFTCPFPHTDLISFINTVFFSLANIRAISLIIDGLMPSVLSGPHPMPQMNTHYHCNEYEDSVVASQVQVP